MIFTVGSLFSGIGGLDLGLERAGMTVRWQSEIDPYACRVLKKHWPDIPNLGDVAAVDWSTVEHVDLICGGYPCQPFSLAGTRAGTNDPRHLWPHFRRAIQRLRPHYALLENVPGHLSLGFGDVLGDLASLGYDTEWDCIPAAAVGAPHLRYRVFVVAHAHCDGESGQPVDAFPRSGLVVPDTDRDDLREQSVGVGGGGGAAVARLNGPTRDVADADKPNGAGWHDGHAQTTTAGAVADARGNGSRRPVADADIMAGSSSDSREWRPGTVGEPGTLARTVGRGGLLGDAWAVEPDVGRVADGIPARMDRLRTLGNAVVPQVAEWLGRRIMAAVT